MTYPTSDLITLLGIKGEYTDAVFFQAQTQRNLLVSVRNKFTMSKVDYNKETIVED